MLDSTHVLAELRDWLAGYRPAFHADALCKEYPAVNFFPERGEDTMRARAICARCLVRDECRQAGIDGDEIGIWGGTSGKNRRDGKLDPPISVGPAPKHSHAERLRIALEMRADGHRHADIAKTLSCSPSAVANMLWRQRQRRAHEAGQLNPQTPPVR